MTIILRHNVPIEAVKTEQEVQSIKQLEDILNNQDSQAKLIGANGEQIDIPESLYQVLRHVVHAMASGQAVSLVPHSYEMTTQQAAEFLNVSRPYVIKLLEQGEIPYIKVGSHRRVCFEDLVRYKEQRDKKRREALNELTQFLQDEGFYDEKNEENDLGLL
ncbi:helix-turn-helix domain-containing protein [Brasilonema octagenarum]|uniref:DNA-binding protein n=1 Tax=Brasilonema octagenarum UFV-OR1 TaxID=417115 RepID=A0ABX1MFZ0_9CYAN|nr:helix-turn-helix domain-containing protein [Brasilonema octagenarum]NMF66313.1 DNA-binding protein [Brasilonema octagenarum UFV-OR1]